MRSIDHSDHYLDPFAPFNGVCLVAALSVAGLVYLLFVRPLISPLSRLPGPPNESILFGNLSVVHGPEGGLRQWHTDFGPTLRFRGFFGRVQLSTIDPKALNHILVSRAYAYPKPETFRRSLGNVLGHGLIYSEGENHKRQKRLLGPTFSSVQIRELAPILYEHAYMLREKWADLIRGSQRPYLVINVLPWLGHATLDMIGSAGFGYQFGALKGDVNSSELGKAFQYLAALGAKRRTPLKMLRADMIQAIPPSLQLYKPPAIKVVEASLKAMRRESSSLLSQKRKEAEAGDLLGGKDLISILVRANTMSEGKESLSDEEVIAQMTTFLLAGHDTTATALTWLLWILAKHPEVQNKLRQELQEASKEPDEDGEEIPVETLNSLQFLDAVCRETLRFLPPVSHTARQASMDDNIPVSGDGDPIRISAGDEIIIPIRSFNLSAAAFGPDAELFRPDRWLERDQISALPGFWAGLMTFLGGPRACIGYRFSLLELKVLVAVIICHFNFEERDGLGCGPEIERQVSVVMRPQVKDEKRGISMPLRVSLVGVS